jgi:hypothetical protein
MRIRVLFATGLAGLLALFCAVSPAQDVKPKLPADVIPAAFRAFLVTDGRFPPVKSPDGKEQPDPRNRTGKIHCLVCENGLAPVIAVFVRADPTTLDRDKGVADLVMKVNAMISDPKYRANKLAAFVMFLRLEGGTKDVTVKTMQDGAEVESKIKQDKEYPDDEKRDEYAAKIRDFSVALNAPYVPFGLAAEKSKALTEWGIKDDDKVTVVAYYRMRKLAEPWRFKEAADLKDDKVTEILKTIEKALAAK